MYIGCSRSRRAPGTPAGRQRETAVGCDRLAPPDSASTLAFRSASFTQGCRIGLFRSATNMLGVRLAAPKFGSKLTGPAPVFGAMKSLFGLRQADVPAVDRSGIGLDDAARTGEQTSATTPATYVARRIAKISTQAKLCRVSRTRPLSAQSVCG